MSGYVGSAAWARGVAAAEAALAGQVPPDETVVKVSLDPRDHSPDRDELVLCLLCGWPRAGARCTCAVG